MIVVEEPDHLTVRLPYFCSVRIYLVDGCLRFEPFFGLVPRTRSTMTKLVMFTGFTLVAFKGGVPWALGIAMIGIMSSIYDVIRLSVTENVISRASLIYAQLVYGAVGPGSAPAPSISSASTRALDSGSTPTVHSPARDELRVRRDG